ncbi:MAG: hypothetical protein K0R60_1537 [Microbacterium sp.]|nr:hypothetical protein [Microbacterium sp.]MDF2555642.1 hypothetical protein [Microbacterium sp.]
MTGAANQHIELDGGVLSKQVTTLSDAATTFQTVGSAVDQPLSGDAFGALCNGILVPAITSLAGRSRELLDSAHTLSDRMSTATESANSAFDALENEAVATFSQDGS